MGVSHPLTLDGLYCYTLYLVFKEPNPFPAGSRHRDRCRPSLGEPSKVTTARRCRQPFCRLRQSRIGGLLAEVFTFTRATLRCPAGWVPVRRTFQYYVSAVAVSTLAAIARIGALLRMGLTILRANPNPVNLCGQPREIRMRKFSRFPFRTTKSWPSIACSVRTRSFSSVMRRSLI
jgi:hypothetical protein